MLKHSFFIAICLLSHILVLAYQITTPSDRDEIEHAAWTTNGPNDIKWERVTTDPETVTVVLVNESKTSTVPCSMSPFQLQQAQSSL
ncbi:hypothetical protein FRC19_009492 [Serendipita sp. 401]|nr:hypothetical protein FRC19_009492 [Serendipita sp. 401]